MESRRPDLTNQLMNLWYFLETKFQLVSAILNTNVYQFMKLYKFKFTNARSDWLLINNDIIAFQKILNGNNYQDYLNMRIDDFLNIKQSLHTLYLEEKKHLEKNK